MRAGRTQSGPLEMFSSLDHKNGKTYYCTNAKEEHPLLLEEGARFCKYHMKLCVNDHTNRGNDNRKFQQIQVNAIREKGKAGGNKNSGWQF